MSKAAYADYADFYLRGPHARYVREHRSAGSTSVRMVRVAQPAGRFPDAPVPDLVLILPLRVSCPAVIDLGAGRWRGRSEVGGMTLTAWQTGADFELDGPHEILALSLPVDTWRPALDGAGGRITDFGRLHAAPFRDGFVESLCRRLWNEAEAGNPHGSLFADGAVLALTATLLRLAGIVPSVASGGLAPWRLRRAVEHIEANLEGEFDLRDLAAAAGLSPFHFARMFRVETGQSPLRYVQARRVERARGLIATGVPLAQAAAAAGFKSQEHFGQVFRRVTGETPGSYRRAIRD